LLVFAAVGGPREARRLLKDAAFNKRYVPPFRLDWLAMQLVTHLKADRDRWRDEAIALKREVSRLKRNTTQPLDARRRVD